MLSQMQQLAALVAQRKMSRRDFLGFALASGISATVAESALTKALAAEPKKGGAARFGLAGANTTDSLDPAYFPDSFTIILWRTFRSNLTEIDPSGALVGDLAESWEGSADAKKWTFKLRRGVEFHDGRPFTAHDVIATLNYHRGEGSKSAMKGPLSPIERISADDPHTLVLELASGNRDLPYLMADYNLGICPAAGDKIDWMAGVGTGGYAIKKFEPGIEANLVRNANYYKAGRAHFDEATLVAINDAAARHSAIANGEVHAINRIEPKVATRLAEQSGLRVLETKSPGHYVYSMNMKLAPFDNADVRMALKHGLDREQFLKTILMGHGTIGNDHPIAPSYPYFAPDIPQRVFDPEQAKHFLKKAGMEKLNVQLHAANTSFTGAVDGAVIYSENAKQAGIEIEVVREPDDGYWDRVWRNKGWFASWWGGRTVEDMILTLVYESGSASNETGFDNERFTKVLREARSQGNADLRREMYRELQLILRDEAGTVVPAFINWIDAASDKIGTPDLPKANNEMCDLRAVERWWLI